VDSISLHVDCRARSWGNRFRAGAFPFINRFAQSLHYHEKTMKLKVLLVPLAAICVSSGISSTAAAQAPFEIQEIRLKGSGCETGTYSMRSRVDDDAQELVIRFREFDSQGEATVYTDGRSRAKANFANCEIGAILKPASGFQVSLIDINLRGQVNVSGPRNTSIGENNVVRIDRSYFFNAPGFPGLPARTTRIVNSKGNFSIDDDFKVLSYAACGQTVLARASLLLNVTGKGNSASIRTLDESSEVRFAFGSRRCTGDESGKGPVILPGASLSSPLYSNICVLEGDGPRREICYDRNGRAYSNDPDPDL